MFDGVDLFTGIGGLTLALSPWVRPIAYCENDRYAQSVLLSRMASGALPAAPIWNDVRTFHGSRIPKRPGIVYFGSPCQGISQAGLRKGLDDERSGLVFEAFRIIRELRPELVFMENVSDITVRGLDRVLMEFAAMGYDARWTIVSAREVGAPHRRQRWFLLAYPHRDRLQEGNQGRSKRRPLLASYGSPRDVARTPYREIQPRVDRAGHGVPARLDRVRALGNSVVPNQAREAFMRLSGLRVTQQVGGKDD